MGEGIDEKAFAAGHHRGVRGQGPSHAGWRAAQRPALDAGHTLGLKHRREMIRAAGAFVRGELDQPVQKPAVDLEGCGDHSCVIAPPKGMGTNGGCRCDERALRRAVAVLRARVGA